MNTFIICILKNDHIVQLHTDRHFYRSLINARGCRPVEYKTRAKADAVARTYLKNSWGPAFACTYSELNELEDSIQFIYNSDERARAFASCAERLNITVYNA